MNRYSANGSAGWKIMADSRGRSQKSQDVDARIVDAALLLAEEVGWDRVRLRQVAERVRMPLAELEGRFRDLDAVADGWLQRAMQAMLAPPPRGFAALPAQERLHVLLMRWFDALAPHRAVTAAMLRGKLYPSHPHHWVPMVFSLSRTIQWLRDAALLDAVGRRRQIEEVGLTTLFLATLAVWCRDDSPEQTRTRAFLRRRLAGCDRTAVAMWGAAPPPGRPGSRPTRRGASRSR